MAWPVTSMWNRNEPYLQNALEIAAVKQVALYSYYGVES